MLQTSDIRRAIGETERGLRNSPMPRRPLPHLSQEDVQIERRPNYLAVSHQAVTPNVQAFIEDTMQELYLHRGYESALVSPVPGNHLSLMPLAADSQAPTIAIKGVTLTVPETRIERVVGPLTKVPTRGAPDHLEDSVQTEEQSQKPPRTSDLILSDYLPRYRLDPALHTAIKTVPHAHNPSQLMLISYIQSDPRDSWVEPPPAVDTVDKAALFTRLTGIGREEFGYGIWDHPIRRTDASGKPGPVEVFSHIPSHLEDLFREIEGLPEDWNSYGASPISPWSIAEARRITNEGMRLGLSAPAVSPASGASVGIEWQTNNTDLMIDVDPQQGITYLIVDRASGVETEGELNAGNLSGVLHQVMGF